MSVDVYDVEEALHNAGLKSKFSEYAEKIRSKTFKNLSYQDVIRDLAAEWEGMECQRDYSVEEVAFVGICPFCGARTIEVQGTKSKIRVAKMG